MSVRIVQERLETYGCQTALEEQQALTRISRKADPMVFYPE